MFECSYNYVNNLNKSRTTGKFSTGIFYEKKTKDKVNIMIMLGTDYCVFTKRNT